jgi:hypothetical protein
MRGSVLVTILLSVRALSAAEPIPPTISSDGLWRQVTQEQIGSEATGTRVLFPKAFRLVRLDVGAFQNIVADAPLEFSAGAANAARVMTLPMPDGSFARFRVEESPIMEPDLAAQLPDVRTYRAEGIDIPEATARLDFTPEGFHGFVLAPAGTVYIDPYRQGDTENYISYWRHDYERSAGAPPFHCDFADENSGGHKSPSTAAAPAAAVGGTLRTYRLALACTGEYAAYYGGTVALAQGGMVTTMNRVNGIYEKELAIRMVLVNNTSICFTNAATDPYQNISSSSDLAANQVTTDANIGSGNYDIGHLFRTGGGGVAYRSVICNSSYKAQGETGLSAPAGDSFDVGYVAHEMGHQFGGRHTFNGTTSGCGIGGGRDALGAYEPGSGSTIMAYPGLCGAEDLQSQHDAYFHASTFDEIVAFTTSITCATQAASGDVPPVPFAGLAITIPVSTPFYLTGSATDADGDPLTYCWEEFDLGTAAPPNTDAGNRPIFRSFNPTTSPIRTFPRLSDLLANTVTLGESLPTTTRTMTFRLTARDNRTGANTTSTTVSVTSAAGPFLVTAPNTNVTWAGGSTQTVTWNVAGTTAAPVSCANVKILLSSDGGNTFPTTLLASTPNDGSQQVAVPSVSTLAARVRVECTTAPFFDISNANFAISIPLTVVAAATTATNVSLTFTAIAGAASYEIYRRGSGGGYVLIGTSATNSFSDGTVAADTAYLYAVKSITGGIPSSLSNPDLATTVIFTNPTLIAQTTRVKAVHITQLRTAVGAVRTLAGLGAYSFADPTLVAGVAPKVIYITDLRTALNAALSALSLPVPSYTDATLIVHTTPIRTLHVTDLRAALQ